MVSEFGGPEDAFEPLGGPKVSKSITLKIETYRNFAPSRASGFAYQMHLFVIDTIHALDSRCVEQYSAVKVPLDVSYCRVSAGIIDVDRPIGLGSLLHCYVAK